MTEIRQAWASFLRKTATELGKIWNQFYDGITGEWDIRVFLLLMAALVIAAGIGMWRRRA